MEQKIKAYVKAHYEQSLDIVRELCTIPAPSHFEEQRAMWCKKWLDQNCGAGAYIDEALNVVFPLNCEGKDDITVIVAHTDTVFPDREPMPFSEDGEKMYSPGIADDTASVSVLLLTAKFFTDEKIVPENGILFVCNSCEEGLGNLKGTRQIFKDYAGRIGRFLSFDSDLHVVNDRCVGSRRYEVEVLTEGGHSFGAFGKKNAIAALSEIVCEIYKLDVPKKEGTCTTYNVGTIRGGTSVNTIAQNAKMLCEYRSDDKDCMAYMQERFERIFALAQTDDVQVNVRLVGDRPCQNVDFTKVEALKAFTLPIIERVVGKEITCSSSSTDCNIPLSLGVPALCIGTNSHGKVHTREEWLDKASMLPGLEVGIRVAMAFDRSKERL